MKVSFLNNVSYAVYPLLEDVVDIDEEVLKEIGKTKQYVDGQIIDYVPKKTISELENWFNNDYRMYCEMLTRRQALGIEDNIVDDFRQKTYTTLMELYSEAELVASEIKELRKEVNKIV